MTGIVHVEVSGLTGSGKSAIMGEIEIALKALGLKVEHGPDFQAEKNATHADWQEALDLYQPTVVLIERNVSRQPEARGEALGNLLAVIHGDGGHRALEVGTKQAALEAEKIVANLLSSAPEAREGEAVERKADGLAHLVAAISLLKRAEEIGKKPSMATGSKKMFDQMLRDYEGAADRMRKAIYTHPAAPSADKLREAVEALEKIERWHGQFPETGDFWPNEDKTPSDRPVSYSAKYGSNGERDFMRSVARQALAALKAEV